MDWLDWARIVLPITGLVAGAVYYFYPRRRYKLPPVIFGQPDPRDDGLQRWWHVPIHIEKPTNPVRAWFTTLELAGVHAETVIAEWGRTSLPMRWESDGLNGVETVNFRFHAQKVESLINNIPVAMRREIHGVCFREIVVDAGETYLTENNFVQHAVKSEEAFLKNGKTYSLTIQLWSTTHPKLSAACEYLLTVPLATDSNNAFTLDLLRGSFNPKRKEQSDAGRA